MIELPPIMPSEDNVVHIRFRKRMPEDLPGAPVKEVDWKAKKQRPFCTTHFFEYDKDERLIQCTRCERKFDAFEAFEHLAVNWRNYDITHRNIRVEIKNLGEERERLKKQIANLKSTRRRLIPNVRQEVERMRGELWKQQREKNPEIARALRLTVEKRIAKVLHTLDTFGDEANEVPKKAEAVPDIDACGGNRLVGTVEGQKPCPGCRGCR